MATSTLKFFEELTLILQKKIHNENKKGKAAIQYKITFY